MESIGDTQEDFAKGWDCYTSGDYVGAIVYFGKVIEEDPKNVDAYKNRAAANVKLGNWDQGLTDFERALAIDPNNEFARINRDMLLKANRIDANFDKGVNCLESRNYQLAIAYFDEVLKEDVENVGAYVNRAGALMGLRDYWEALADFERALTIDPGNEHLTHNRIVLLAEYSVVGDPFVIPQRSDFGPLNRYPLETFNKDGVSSADLGEYGRSEKEELKLKWVDQSDKPEVD